MQNKRASRQVRAGKVLIGGGAPITVQSMLNKPAHDTRANVLQAQALEQAGCEIIRVAVPDAASVPLVAALKEAVKIPVVADIHFDYKLALESIAAGVDKIRLNPGNIGDKSRVKAVANACAAKNIPIRIGVNSGSVNAEQLSKFGGPTPAAMVESALEHVRLLEENDFGDIVVSIKSSNVADMVSSYEIIAEKCDYPLHLGVTEAGTARTGLIKSSAGLGALLLKGIGDTVRVSMTEDPMEEVRAGLDILRALGLRKDSPMIISCPTCGRTQVDLIELAKQVEARLAGCKKPITVAVMGCIVNGPGEAREADIGIAAGSGKAAVFKKGVHIRTVDESVVVDALMEEIEQM
ncbi:MAG: flavodoxin-dependent (E)-4-hydroxy-3-methylbut-2-enyl-diphosphate synthase [Acutalibacteraceae bacterium]